MRGLAVILSAVILMLWLAPSVTAKDKDPIYTSWQNNDAVGGYDVVSFYSGKPKEGLNMFQLEHLGARWKFATRANMDLFKTNPEAFIPQYGGYCAWAMANRKLAKGSPKHWKIIDGNLYLNYNSRIQEQWERDTQGLIEKADDNWPQILND